MGKDNVHYRPHSGSTIMPLSAHRLNVELGSHIQEKSATFGFSKVHAGYTCENCEQPFLWKHDATGARIWCNTTVPHDEWGWVTIDPPEPLIRCKPCNNRRERAKRVRRNLRFVAERDGLDSLRFITLTLRTREKTEDYDLAEDLDFFKTRVKNFARTVEFKSKIEGASIFYEVKESKGRLHTHAHICASGRFWSQRDLESAWGGRVDIRRVTSTNRLAGYLAGYLAKSEPFEGRRCRESIGSHRGVPRLRKEYFDKMKHELAFFEKHRAYLAKFDFFCFLAGNYDYQQFWMKCISS